MELLPCPFCGNDKIAYEETITARTVRCERCSAKIVRDVSTVLPEHVWNSRMVYPSWREQAYARLGAVRDRMKSSDVVGVQNFLADTK